MTGRTAHPRSLTVETQPDTDCQVSHGVPLDSDNESYLAQDDTPSLNAIVRYHRLREKNLAEYRELWRAMNDTQKRKILASVWHTNKRGLRHEPLVERLTVSERTVYRKLDQLEEAGLINRVGKPVFVFFATEEIRIMAGDVLEAAYQL